MVDPKALFELLEARGVGMFAGVPDSLLSSFCAYVDDNAPGERHVITANEGNAVALALGHHLATGKVSVVYMQNSGLGNAINPLASLADAEVYRVPMLLVIGWRGEPGVHDEPQHVKQGRITPGQLELLDVPAFELDAGSDAAAVVDAAFEAIDRTHAPVAILVHKDAFAKYKTRRTVAQLSPMSREQALAGILDLAAPSDLVVSTTGKASREVYELRATRGEAHRDFLTVGGMGHTSSIALGVALGQPGRRVLCIDGDGSMLMHMGALPIIGSLAPANLVHVLLNNAAHESVGGQPTVADRTDFRAVALASGYRAYHVADSAETLAAAWQAATTEAGPVLLEVRVACGARADLGRPATSPEQNKNAFMEHARGPGKGD